jgi:hypothetical protein
MFNYANDIDIYYQWANIVVNNTFSANASRKYYCCYIGRKNRFNYAHNSNEIFARFHDRIVFHTPINGVFAAALGDYGYLARSPVLDKVLETAYFIHEKS